MSIVPRGYKIFSNLISFPELFNFKCVESKYAADPKFIAIRELIKQKDCQSHEKVDTMNRYYAHFVMTFTLKKTVFLDERELGHSIEPYLCF